MEWVGTLYVVGLFFILVSLLTIAGFVFQRYKHWMRVWERLGKPEVKSIRELKAYINKQSRMITPVKHDRNHISPLVR